MAKLKIVIAILIFTFTLGLRSDSFVNYTPPKKIHNALVNQILHYNQGHNYTYGHVNHINNLLRISEYEFNINAIDMIALMSHESEFNKHATGRNKKRKKVKATIDYGITQQNSCCINYRYLAASKVLDKYNIPYNLNNKYDVGLNIISGAMFLGDIKRDLISKNKFTRFRMFATYNCGTYKLKGRKLRKAIRYHNAIEKIKTTILRYERGSDRTWPR